MNLIETEFNGLFLIEPNVRGDERGYFFEAYNERELAKLGLKTTFVQDNQSFSMKGVVRGLHYQNAPFAQTKLVRVLSGRILDVVVDLRKEESTFGKWFSVELSAEDKRQIYVPIGFAHGFSVLSETAEILYKCDQFYNRDMEGGISINDPAIGIDWRVPLTESVLSLKDANNPLLADATYNF
jgi:dTDP-4-dehydrorhamnose 3,5-epimerase